MRTVKRIVKIHQIKGYKLYCLFNNGESRIIDFKQLFSKWKTTKKSLHYPLVNSLKEFKKAELIDGTITWKNIIIKGEDEFGNRTNYYYDLDPIVLYEESQLDESRQLEIGMLIRKTRNELGLTQEELASKSGTTKHYISKLENNRIGIELSTLRRIIEGGLGKRMKISLQ
jgi:DNA-binding XRE family transcriptional regulator